MSSIDVRLYASPHPSTILLWVKPLYSFLQPLSLNILREVCAYFQPFALLAWLSHDSIASFDFHHQQLCIPQPLSIAIQCDWNSRWAVIDSERIVICGGSNECKV